MSDCVNVAIFASNSGLNTENIIKYFEYYLDVKVSCVITNNKDAEFINNIRRYKVPVYVENGYKNIDTILTQYNVHYIVLDEYMDKIPPNFCNKYMWKIINIHQSILPKYGGKGMYGNNIHKLVKNNKS